MPTTTYITLQEHNSSRLLFVDIPELNNGSIKLMIRDTTIKSSDNPSENTCEKDGYCEYPFDNYWLLGHLSPKVWLLEDCGVYDSNHVHSCEIYYIDPNSNTEVILYNITRAIEYQQECDRMYLEHSGGTKLLLLEPTDKTIETSFFIKYEKNLPGFEEVETQIGSNGENIHYVVFYRYDNLGLPGISEVMSITNQLNISVEDDNGNSHEINDIDYMDIDIKNVDIAMSHMSIQYNIGANNGNDIKLGILGVNTNNHKFISYLIENTCIEPTYFIAEVPKNRSWICLRTCQGFSNYPCVFYNNPERTIGSSKCGYFTGEGFGLTGYYGTYDSLTNTYRYEINIDRNNLPFALAIPLMFGNFSDIEDGIIFKDVTGNKPRYTLSENPVYIYNELDGMEYVILFITTEVVTTAKIILIYDA